MTARWHPDEDATPSPRDVAFMAAALEGQYGQYAAQIADFFSSVHCNDGDAGRAWAWAGVAEVVRRRQRDRLEETDIFDD